MIPKNMPSMGWLGQAGLGGGTQIPELMGFIRRVGLNAEFPRNGAGNGVSWGCSILSLELEDST